ncbi:MAG: hypothetical protein SPK69_00925 [Synergistales bacterium]|nr:hypothetical protein [Synergistales bacterium]MDY6403806.1 hypothetical protein [Synergistales bacterium]MDY6410176.1 hypothetical protein [Synergistales bacterium]MDY6421666.1 hypothetical protein [Synergistales bacterium]MDY6428780.1 hypothetical protein [Synergistales bacterium]
MQSAIKNPEKLIAAINDFADFIKSKDGDRPISFVDESSFLGSKEVEGYKMSVAKSAQDELNFDEWEESWINSGKILERCKKAVNRSDNLVSSYEKIRFKNIINPEHKNFNPRAERALYEIYKSKTADEEKAAFENATKNFGRHYALIAYLFFIKDPSRFLPVSPRNFDNIFSELSIEYKLERYCSWENYMGFIKIVKEVLKVMQSQEDIFNVKELRLIDAHSFLWINHWRGKIPEWNKEHK